MTDDAQLLHRYASQGSEQAFAEFVQRHIRWVYHASLRRAGGRHHLAQEISQYVFTAAARNAGALSRRTSVAGWLHITIRHGASRTLRSEARRHVQETAAALAMIEPEASAAFAEWEQVRPALDEVMDRLPETDREVLLLRFFEGLGLKQIGTVLNLTEDGARKRVDRALEKLHRILARRGITSSSSALGALLAGKVSAAVAPEVQAAITTGALSGGAVSGSVVLGVLQFMSTTKATVGGWGAAAALLCLLTGGVALYETRQARAEEAALADAKRLYDAAFARFGRLIPGLPGPTAATSVSPPPAVSKVAAPAAALAQETRRADGQAFLNAFGGAAREQYRELVGREIQRKFGLFFHLTGLDQEKRQALLDRTIRLGEQTLEVTSSSMTSEISDLPADEMRAVLGSDGYRQWQDFNERADTANRWVMNVAKSAGDQGEPLSLDQLAALQRLVCENSPEYRAGGRVLDPTVTWDSVYRDGQKLLTALQWQAAQPFLLMRFATHSLEAVAEQIPGPLANPKP